MFLFILLLMHGASSLNVTVKTSPPGPPFKAGSIIDVLCEATGGNPPYVYQWAAGCSARNTSLTHAALANGHNLYSRITTNTFCRDLYSCQVSDNTSVTKSDEIKIEPIMGTALQLETSLDRPRFIGNVANISILTVNESGQFFDIVCVTGLLRPGVGEWIFPTGLSGESKLEVVKDGGSSFPAYAILRLREGHSLNIGEGGLFNCKMPDKNNVEHDNHIWILHGNKFDAAQPELFTSHSGRIVKLKCVFSQTPGEIRWFYKSTEIRNNDSFTISQQLRDESTSKYEGVLEINDHSYVSRTLTFKCEMFNRVIGNTLPASFINNLRVKHTFILYRLGTSNAYFSCSFDNPNITSIHLYTCTDEKIAANKLVNGTFLKHTLGFITDDMHNKKYCCRAVTSSEGSMYLNVTIVVVVSDIILLVPPNPLIGRVTVDFSNTVLAGVPTSFTLSVENWDTTGFSNNPLFSCYSEDGTSIMDIEEFTQQRSLSRIQVSVESVKLSLAGMYYCIIFIETHSELDDISDRYDVVITVKIPSPTISLVAGNIMSNMTNIGSIATHDCEVLVNVTYLDVPICPVFIWIINGEVVVLNDDRISTVTTQAFIQEGKNIIKYISKLTIAPVLMADEGLLTCVVYIKTKDSNELVYASQLVNSSRSIKLVGNETLSSVLIQLQLIQTGYLCSELVDDGLLSLTLLENITREIVQVVTDKCRCEYAKGYIVDRTLNCSSEQSMSITFRATLLGTDKVEAETLAKHLQTKVESGLTIQSFTVASDCDVMIRFSNDTICEDNQQSSNLEFVIVTSASICLGGLFVLMAILVAFCLVRWCCKRLSMWKNHTVEGSMEVDKPTVYWSTGSVSENVAYSGRPAHGTSIISDGSTVHDYDYIHYYY